MLVFPLERWIHRDHPAASDWKPIPIRMDSPRVTGGTISSPLLLLMLRAILDKEERLLDHIVGPSDTAAV